MTADIVHIHVYFVAMTLLRYIVGMDYMMMYRTMAFMALLGQLAWFT
jgi:hypothetical protein